MNPINLGLSMIFHPSDTFVMIKRRHKSMSIAPSVLIYILMVALRYLTILATHRPMIGIDIEDTDILLELALLLLPPLTWGISIYGITSVFGGETDLKEIFLTVSYCFTPYLIITPISIALSHLLVASESGLHNGIITLMWVWIILLLFISTVKMNNYSVTKGFILAVVSLVGVVLIWIVLVLAFAFILQIVLFIRELLVELGILSL